MNKHPHQPIPTTSNMVKKIWLDLSKLSKPGQCSILMYWWSCWNVYWQP